MTMIVMMTFTMTDMQRVLTCFYRIMAHTIHVILVLLGTCLGALISDADARKTYPVITHVLDVSKGKPGNGLKVQFYRNDQNGWSLFQDKHTNWNGRLNHLIPRQNFTSGRYFEILIISVSRLNKQSHVPALSQL